MNGYNYPPASMTQNQLPQLTPLSNLSTRPYQHDSPGPSQTLPPLHTQTNPSSFPPNVYRDSPQTPRTPQSSASTTGQQRTANLSQIAPQPAYSGQQSHHYPPLAPNYSAGHGSNYPGIPGHNHAQPNGNVGPYAPMTLPQPPFYESPHNQDPSLAVNSPYSATSQQQGGKDMGQRVLPVVGSQGRRGVLPTNNGRTPPLVSSSDGTTASRVNAVKGPDGRFSCQYCNKVYLHLKHLKRHHLRHTGERPYQCHLCHETFCRSDILKRHFAKCALRRGNPTGANHLTHAQAHLGRPPNMASTPSQGQANGAPTSAQSTNPALYRTSWQPGDPNTHGQATQDPPAGGHAGGPPVDSNLSSRSSSIIRPGSSNADDKKRFSGTNTNMTSVNNSIDTSPTSSGALSQNGDRKPALLPSTSKQEPLPHSAHYGNQQSTFYNNQPPPAYPQTTQTPNFPHYQYNSPNGYRSYHNNQYDDHLVHYFQPNGQDTVMFSHQ